MIEPIPKPKKRPPSDHGRAKWQRVRRHFLEGKADFQGYYICAACGGKTLAPEVDHVIKRSVAPDRIYDVTNLQVLCHMCHLKKDFGMNVK